MAKPQAAREALSPPAPDRLGAYPRRGAAAAP
jgi:hypothetical protein